MPSPTLRSLLVLVAALLVGSCNEQSFGGPTVCQDCPVPRTKPPVVTWVSPTNGATVSNGTLLTVSAVDDRQIVGVEFWYYNIKILPGMDGSAPYQVELGKYMSEALPGCGGPIVLTAIGYDVEGNADTASVGLNYLAPASPSCSAPRRDR